MKFHALKYAALAACAIFYADMARAEGGMPPENCFAPTAEITPLRAPQFDNARQSWSVLYAEDGMDVFSDIVPVDEVSVVAFGSYTNDKKDTIYKPLIVKYGENNKVLWAVREKSPFMKTIYRALKTKEGFTVVGDINDPAKGQGIFLASYDDSGSARGKAVPFFEPGGNLNARAIVPAQDGSGYIIAAQYIKDGDEESQHGYLFKISRSGKLIWKRSYKSGLATVFHNIQTAADGRYMVTGQIILDEGKSGAWFLRVDENGAIEWQRHYPRGEAATFQAAAQTKEGDFILTGKARPAEGEAGILAAWIMKTDSTGNPLWQRYLTGGYSYEAPDLILYEDGRASVLINALAMGGEERSHARIATFSPQGNLQSLDEFTNGQNAFAGRLASSITGEQIVIGYAQTSFGENQESNEAGSAPAYTFDAWLAAAPAPDLYENPCAQERKPSPILP